MTKNTKVRHTDGRIGRIEFVSGAFAWVRFGSKTELTTIGALEVVEETFFEEYFGE